MDKDGRKVSQQLFAIIKKIKAVDDLLQGNDETRKRVYEVHPEVSFAAWNRGHPMAHRKKSREGKVERQKLIAEGFGEGLFEDLRTRIHGQGVGRDDLADALAALWSARRIHAGKARRFPEQGESDKCVLPMIWY